jgi:valyl-tRNA synthetase
MSQSPKPDLPKAYDPSVIEQRWAETWVRERLFEVPTPAPGDTTPRFTQLLPPPNVTGRLHIGHMLEHTQMDILTRWRRMSGDTAVWVPGTDHAGIATQMMVERQLAAEGTTTRRALGREAFTERVWAWKQQYGSAITDQMRRLGASVDWSREYFTMDDRLSVAVKEAFVRLYEQGLIYRGAYIVNWDPQIQTAVSDLEVDSEERIGKLYHVLYPFVDGPINGQRGIVVATTRPETMLGDTAVAVNPNDDRYKHLIGHKVQLPLTQREIPILGDDWANPEFGTGAVKVTPAHDPNDFAIGQRHNLPNLTILDATAHIDLPGSPFHGKDRYEARDLIVAQLEGIELLVKVQDHPMTVPISQRTGVIVEPRLSMQWFIKIQPLADKAIAAVEQGHITFTPDNNRKTYMEWMTNIHDWCISRQLWWGHRIPAWHCGACSNIVVTRDTPTTCPNCANTTTLTQETDVLDTWFSSGLLPFTVFGWDGTNALTPDLATFYPTQQLVTGFDILFFWVARMIMLSCHFMLDVPMPDGTPRTLADAVPFRNVYIHALVRDADRQKISKTKGNVIDPIEIVTQYGTDAVRFTLASQASPGTDIAFNEARTEGYRAFANKIWNAARFLQMNIDRGREAGYKVTLRDYVSNPFELPPDAPDQTKSIVSLLGTVSAEVDRSLAAYRFDEAANALYQFFWIEFCDSYLEYVKSPLDFGCGHNDITALTLNVLVTVFEAALRLLSPFMPFLTEELWHSLYAMLEQPSPAKSIALSRYPQSNYFPSDITAVTRTAVVSEFMTNARNSRKQAGAPEKEFMKFEYIPASPQVEEIITANAATISRQIRSTELIPVDKLTPGSAVVSSEHFDIAPIYARQIDVPAERERLTKDLAKYEKGLFAAGRQLGNEAFMAKAPAAIVEGLRKQAAETRMLYDKTKAALEALPPS